MSDTMENVWLLVEQAMLAGEATGVNDDVVSAIADAILSTLTPGSRWTLPDGREMVAVPADASGAYVWHVYEIAAASEPDAPAQVSERDE